MPAMIDIDRTNGIITITPEDTAFAPIVISVVDLDKYRETLNPNPPLYCYKSTQHDPLTMSPAEGRYSKGGCLYTITSLSGARAEASDWEYRNLYTVTTPHPINLLNFTRVADDYGLRDTITQHVSAGGWVPTQQLADYLTNQFGVSAIVVPSTKSSDDCINFYADDRLPDDFLTLCSPAISSTSE